MVISGATTSHIKRAALEENMISLRKAGIKKILEGHTTIEEVLGVTVSDTA
jgi:type IV pilus assembly protein PilB